MDLMTRTCAGCVVVRRQECDRCTRCGDGVRLVGAYFTTAIDVSILMSSLVGQRRCITSRAMLTETESMMKLSPPSTLTRYGVFFMHCGSGLCYRVIGRF